MSGADHREERAEDEGENMFGWFRKAEPAPGGDRDGDDGHDGGGDGGGDGTAEREPRAPRREAERRTPPRTGAATGAGSGAAPGRAPATVTVPRAEWERLSAALDRIAELDKLEGRLTALEQDAARREARLGARIGALTGLPGRAERAEAALEELAVRAEAGLSRIDGLSRLHDALSVRLGATEAAAEAAARRLAEHDEVLDLMRAGQVSERTDLTDERALSHYAFADRLKALFTQRLPEVIGPRTATDGGDDVVLREAELVRQMCGALFGTGTGEPDLAELNRIVTDGGRIEPDRRGRRLLDRVGQEAADLLQSMAASGHPTEFVFDLPAGTVADPDRHILWPTCEPGRPVAFVVCPAYRAAGLRVLEPTVFALRGGKD
ncbi:hypothetical protein OG937_30075 [Streptomyces sp. NBC_00510]